MNVRITYYFLNEIGNNRIKNEYIYKKKIEEEKKNAR